MEESKTIIITYASLKGGVGKTTSSIMTAANLAKRGCKVLFMDFDTNNSATMHFTAGIEGIDDIIIKRNIFEMMSHNNIMDNIVKTNTDKIDIIPSSLDISKVRSCSFNVLQKALKTLPQDTYDYIVIDTAPNYDNILINILIIADLIITPIQLKKFNLTTTANLQKNIFDDCPEAINHWYLLISYWRKNVAIASTSIQSQYENFFTDRFTNILDVHIPDTTFVNDYIETGKKVNLSSTRFGQRELALAYNELVNMIQGKDKKDESVFVKEF